MPFGQLLYAYWSLLAVILLSLTIGVCFGVVAYRRDVKVAKTNPAKPASFGDCFIGGLLVALVSCLFVSLATLKRIQAESIAVRGGAQVVAAFPDKSFLFKWDRRLAGTAIESYSRREIIREITTSPITANPEVRSLELGVSVVFGGGVPEYMKFRNSSWSQQTKSRLDYYLWEFENHFHGQLVVFYNPEDKDQQMRFRQLLTGYLQPYLEGSGLTIGQVYFKRK